MEVPLSTEDVPEAYTEENPRLTYLHLGIQAALLLNSGAVDFVITAAVPDREPDVFEYVSRRCMRILY